MKKNYTTLLLDIGGVFLTNGWDRTMRAAAAERFQFDLADFDKRHALTFDTYEIGKITLDDYLTRTLFYKERSFSREAFKTFMFQQSQPHPEMLALLEEIRLSHPHLTIAALSNEGRELMQHRIDTFKLDKCIDFFICSAFVGLRKPDDAIYKMALEIAHARPEETIYIDDRELLAEIGASFGLKAIRHKNYEETARQLKECLS